MCFATRCRPSPPTRSWCEGSWCEGGAALVEVTAVELQGGVITPMVVGSSPDAAADTLVEMERLRAENTRLKAEALKLIGK